MAHPTRERNLRGSRPAAANPSPSEVIAARKAAGDTQTQAARRIYATLRTWQCWEAEEGSPEHRRMHAGLFELYLLKTGLKSLDEVLDIDARGRVQEARDD